MAKNLVITGADFSQVAVEKVNFIKKVQITAISSPIGGGTVSGSGGYNVGDTVTLVATPSAHYEFNMWNDGNTNATRNIIVGDSDATYIAIFIYKSWVEIDLNSYTNLKKELMLLNDGSNQPYSLMQTKLPQIDLSTVDMYCIPANPGDIFRVQGNYGNNTPIIVAVSQQYEIWDNSAPYTGPNYNLGFAANTIGEYNEGQNVYRDVEFIVPAGSTYVYVQSRNSQNPKFITGYDLKVEKMI